MSEKKKKGMKKNEKIVILVLAIILIAVIIFAVVRNSSSDTEETETSSTTESSETELESAGDYSVVLEDGTKLNTSSKLNEDKTLEGLELTDIQLTESEGITQILATVTNTSDEVQGGYIATITLLDAEGNELIELSPYIEELEPDESTQLNISATFDYSDAYDFTITK